MIDVENIRKAALYYVNNDVTLEDAALYVGIKSKKTLNSYFARLCNSEYEKDKLLYKKIFQILKNKDKLNYNEFYLYLKYIYSKPFTYQACYAISDLYVYGLYDIYLKDPEKAFYLYKRVLCKNNKSKKFFEDIGIPISYGENVRKLIRKKDDNE